MFFYSAICLSKNLKKSYKLCELCSDTILDYLEGFPAHHTIPISFEILRKMRRN